MFEKSFVNPKSEAYADAEAEFAKQGKQVPGGYVPPIDLWQMRQFRTAEERRAMEASPTPLYSQLKKRREARAVLEQEAAEASRRESQEKKDKKETAWLEEMADRKANREREAKEREERHRLQREFAATARANNKRKREIGDADPGATQRKQVAPSTKRQTNSVIKGGARVSHGTARWRPMIVDSDDEADLLPKAKRVRDSKEEPVVVRADTSSSKRKRDGSDSEDSDNEPLALKRRWFQFVRPESNKENLGQKKVVTKAANGGDRMEAKPERPAALGTKTKMSTTAGVSKTTKTTKKPTRKVQVAKDEPAKAPEKNEKKTHPIPSHRPIRSREDPFRSSSSGDARRNKVTRLTQKLMRASNASVGSAYKSSRTAEEQLQSQIFGRRW